MSTNPSFDLFRISEDHEAIREAVRVIAQERIAPYAADVDETGTFPQAAHDALVATDFHAPHVPTEYGGAGADALATGVSRTLREQAGGRGGDRQHRGALARLSYLRSILSPIDLVTTRAAASAPSNTKSAQGRHARTRSFP